MKLPEFMALLVADNDLVCARCEKAVQVWMDAASGEIPTGIVCEGEVYCLDCLEAVVNEPHPLTLKRPQR